LVPLIQLLAGIFGVNNVSFELMLLKINFY
jgi:hypothetical protein